MSDHTLSDSRNRGQYLIITTEALEHAVELLADEKRDRYSVMIVTKEKILDEFQDDGDGEDVAIRKFLIYAALNWTRSPRWVVLAGDIDSIPTHIEQYESDDTEDLASDHYYANLAGSLVQNLTISRLPTSDPDELEELCLKAVNYKFKRGDWINNVCLVAYNSGGYIDCSNDIYDVIHRRYDTVKRYADTTTRDDVIDTLNDGTIITNYRGHGSSDSWSSSNGLDRTHVQALDTENMSPLITSIACWNSHIDWEDICFGATWVNHMKSIGFLGASRPSYTYWNHHFNRYIFEGIMKGRDKPGVIMNYAKMQLLKHHDGDCARDNVRMYLLMGDPELEIFEVDTRPARIYWNKYHDSDDDSVEPGHNYGNFGSSLRSRGHIIDEYDDPITMEELDGYDILIVPDPDTALGDDEIEDIKEWVKNGHGLFVLCEHEDAFHKESVNRLIQSFGMRVSGSISPRGVRDFRRHRITECVNKLQGAGEAFGELTLSGSSMEIAKASGNHIFAAAANFGYGKVVVVADSDVLKNEWISPDGLIFADNTVRWLQRYGGKGRKVGDMWAQHIEGVGSVYGQELTSANVFTISELSEIDPVYLSTKVEIPLPVLITLKVRAQLAMGVETDKDAFERILNWDLYRILSTSTEEVCQVSQQSEDAVEDLKLNIGKLFVTMNNWVLRDIKLGYLFTSDE
ncbi:MAG: C25 family cysteine peptidase [Thermoplasmata archaeon]